MINRLRIDEIAQKISNILPSGTDELTEDIKKNLKVTLSASLARLDLVTREEFDAQSQLLLRTRMKLEALEKQVAMLEAEITGASHT